MNDSMKLVDSRRSVDDGTRGAAGLDGWEGVVVVSEGVSC